LSQCLEWKGDLGVWVAAAAVPSELIFPALLSLSCEDLLHLEDLFVAEVMMICDEVVHGPMDVLDLCLRYDDLCQVRNLMQDVFSEKSLRCIEVTLGTAKSLVGHAALPHPTHL